jgi:hypothetical protein
VSEGNPSRLEPLNLATWLEAWALRREKVLELLDVQASTSARGFALRCRRLARTRSQESKTYRREWLTLRLEIADFLESASRKRVSATYPKADGGVIRAESADGALDEKISRR